MGIIDNAKEIADLVKNYNNQDLYEKIVDLRAQIIELKEENIRLKEKNDKLEAAIRIEEEIIKDGNCYFRKSDEERKHPYCMTCWDVDRKLVSLVCNQIGEQVFIVCNICKQR